LLQQALSDSDGNGSNPRAAESPGVRGRFVAPAPAELARRFPDLEIIELLGQGGMGAVYKARQKKLDRLVALKIMPPDSASDPAFAERFAREARALARLNHPSIVGVHDYGEVDGLYHFIMEYVDGLNLRQLMQGKPIDPALALQIVPQICDALQYAHDENVVHRDIKPENILIDKRGRVKIADFGLAKLVGRAPAFTLTASQQIMGTPHYMAPEQMERPSGVDHRADIYSLGVVFYEMLTGELPLGRFAAPSQKVAVDQRLDEVVLRALEREPERRYQSISAIKTDVEALVAAALPPQVWSSSAQERPWRDTTPVRVMAPAAGLMFVGLLSFLSWVFLAGILADKFNWKQPFWELLAFLALLAVGSSIGILFVGGFRMMRFQSYALAEAASIWAMFPWSPAFVIGLPFGLWALLVLNKPEVKLAFLGRRFGTSPGGRTAPSASAGGAAPMPGFFGSLRDFVFDSLARRQSTVAAPSGPPAEAAPAPRPATYSPSPSSGLKRWVAAAEQASGKRESVSKRRTADAPGSVWGNVIAIAGMIGVSGAMAQLILHDHSSSLLPWLPVIPFVGYYIWHAAGGTYRGRIASGIIGLAATVFIAMKYRHDSDFLPGGPTFGPLSWISAPWGLGWISLMLDFWFFSWLLGQKTGEERAATADGADEPSTLAGLSAESKEIRRLLLSFQSQFNCYVLPEFGADLLAVCRKVCNVPPEERILGLIDFTGNEDGDNVVLFGCQALYFFNYKKSPQPGPHSLSYDEFGSRTFANHGKEVYLGNNQFLYTDPDAEIDCEALTSLLNAIKETLVR
jgi:serine/threonine protein kinase